MIAAKITNTRLVLSELAGSIPEDAWLLVKRAQDELACAADMAARLESTLTVPDITPRILHPIRQKPDSSSAAPRLRLITPREPV